MKQLITLSLAISCFIQVNLAQDSAQIVKDSGQIEQEDSAQITGDSIQTKQDSLQIAGDSIEIKQDSAQITRDSIQVEQHSVQIAKFNSPYTTRFKTDFPIIVAGVGLTGLGVYLIQNKKDLTAEELITKTKDKIPFFDHGNAGFYSKKANDGSYIPFEAAFAMPVVMMLVNKNERQKFGQILVLYIETMAITGTMFSITAGAINRSRPLVYGTNAPLSLRLAGKSQRSFYAGHTASAAAATFFAARVFQDFNPDSKAKPYVWAVAAIIPAVTGYLRYKAGMHFLSDNILGYIIGAGTGILIPKWHRNKALKNLNITPETGYNYKGISVNYRF